MYYLGAVVVYALTLVKMFYIAMYDIEIKSKRNLLLIIGIAPVILIPLFADRTDVTYYEDVVAIGLILFLVLVKRTRKAIVNFLCYALILIAVSYVVENALDLVNYLSNDSIKSEFLFFWIVQALSLSITIFTVLLIRRMNQTRREQRFHRSWRAYGFLLFAVAMVVVFAISGLEKLRILYVSPRFQIVMRIVSMLSYAAIVILAMIALIMYSTNMNLETMLLQESELRMMQGKYHDLLVEKDHDTRKFRHDTAGHVIHVMELAKQENALKTLAYLQQYCDELGEIQKWCVDTGYEGFDILMNYYFSRFDESTISRVIGRVQPNTKIAMSDYDVCTVLSNVFQNIYEEFGQLQGEKKLTIEFRQNSEYLNMRISNSMQQEKWNKAMNEISNSRKSDSENHGFGLRSIRSTMDKTNGIYRCYTEDNEFVNDLFFAINTVQ